MKEYIRIKKRTAWGCLIITAIAAILTAAWILLPLSGRKPDTERIEIRSYNTLKADGRNVMYFRGMSRDTSFLGLSTDKTSVGDGQRLSLSSGELHAIVALNKEKLAEKLKALAEVASEIDYYMSIHNVQDEGFGMVVEHAETVSEETARTKRLLECLDGIRPEARLEVERTVILSDSVNDNRGRVFIECYGGIWTGGFWLKTKRQGPGIVTDRNGRWICGEWDADTLKYGRRTDAKGTYLGTFDRELQADAHGKYEGEDGTFYEGRWSNDRRDGFGFEAGAEIIRTGEWKNDVYKGERLNYTSERIYGIDISRYQHGKGKKYYPIHWNKLRITHLGNISRKQVSGKVDYPVSFVYIKSTEGTSVRNRYYGADYRLARRNGIPCGAYHFFSTKSDGAAQARFFIKHSNFRRGDLPPVLDVEPTHSQIVRMGGEQALFNAIRAWMRIVKQHTGVRPVLYVNQTFVNRYLNNAPDIKLDYNIWIARYGEYKPDIKLVYWQLCPDGRVNGIHGDVDINVFNGYRDRFDRFLETERIR